MSVPPKRKDGRDGVIDESAFAADGELSAASSQFEGYVENCPFGGASNGKAPTVDPPL